MGRIAVDCADAGQVARSTSGSYPVRDGRLRAAAQGAALGPIGGVHLNIQGVYDVAGNEGWVNVGDHHDTPALAVASIARTAPYSRSNRRPMVVLPEPGEAAKDNEPPGRIPPGPVQLVRMHDYEEPCRWWRRGVGTPLSAAAGWRATWRCRG